MSVSRRGFLASIVLACAGARRAVVKKFPHWNFASPRQKSFYEEVTLVELERVREMIPPLFERNSAFFSNMTKNGHRSGGRRRWQGGRTHSVERG